MTILLARFEISAGRRKEVQGESSYVPRQCLSHSSRESHAGRVLPVRLRLARTTHGGHDVTRVRVQLFDEPCFVRLAEGAVHESFGVEFRSGEVGHDGMLMEERRGEKGERSRRGSALLGRVRCIRVVAPAPNQRPCGTRVEARGAEKR